MDLIEMADEVNKETKKLNAVADLMFECNTEIDGDLKDGIAWIVSDSAVKIKKMVNEYLKQGKR